MSNCCMCVVKDWKKDVKLVWFLFFFLISTEVKDVVNPILFLLSDQSEMINCVTLPIDGGFLAC